jgi:hypothetical protein
MSLIPNRKPATPLLPFFAEGKYSGCLPSVVKHRRFQAVAGASASYTERNKKEDQEVNIKPQLQQHFSSKFYKAGKYLNPYGSMLSSFPDQTSQETQPRAAKDINLNKIPEVKPECERQINFSVVDISQRLNRINKVRESFNNNSVSPHAAYNNNPLLKPTREIATADSNKNTYSYRIFNKSTNWGETSEPNRPTKSFVPDNKEKAVKNMLQEYK